MAEGSGDRSENQANHDARRRSRIMGEGDRADDSEANNNDSNPPPPRRRRGSRLVAAEEGRDPSGSDESNNDNSDMDGCSRLSRVMAEDDEESGDHSSDGYDGRSRRSRLSRTELDEDSSYTDEGGGNGRRRPPPPFRRLPSFRRGGGRHSTLAMRKVESFKATFFDPAMAGSKRIQIKHFYPRLYYVSTHLVIPLLFLIAMCFLFGWILAIHEMSVEIELNDQALASVYDSYSNHTNERKQLYEAMANSSEQCLREGMKDEKILVFHSANTVEQLYNCSYQAAQQQFPYLEPFVILVQSNPELTFDWMKCGAPNFQKDPDYEFLDQEGITYDDLVDYYFPKLGFNPKDNRDQQIFRYMLSYDVDVRQVQAEHKRLNPDLEFNATILHAVLHNATGSAQCETHTAGGALFWFTIMTTIGYGNTSPKTDGGRLLVFLVGFATIIGFLILNNTAGAVWKNLIEDFFLTYNMDYLVNPGFASVSFWLALTFTWMLVIAGAMAGYRQNRGGSSDDFQNFKDAYWFSYITVTTVGLGDYHFEHEDFSTIDMFYIPLIVLMGFNFLGVFAEKGTELYNKHFPERTDFKDILEARRVLAKAGISLHEGYLHEQDHPSVEYSEGGDRTSCGKGG